MVPRQRWLFKLGCWIAIGTAVLHMAGQVAGGLQPENEAERQVLEQAAAYKFLFPGGAQRSLIDLNTGFSLLYALLLATIGGLGLIVAKRGAGDVVLLRATTRTLAASGVVMLVISFVYFFVVPTMCMALVTLCFALASVSPPEA